MLWTAACTLSLVEMVAAARAAAEGLLARALPRRWNHVQAVAAKAGQISVVLPLDERPILLAAAWLHDVGYATEAAKTGFHALDGARWLRDRGFDERIVRLVAHHSCSLFEADERGLGAEFVAEFATEESAASDALGCADMTTGPDGQDMSVQERLAEIRSRYSPDHAVSRFWSRAEPAIIAAVQRTEERLAATTHPM